MRSHYILKMFSKVSTPSTSHSSLFAFFVALMVFSALFTLLPLSAQSQSNELENSLDDEDLDEDSSLKRGLPRLLPSGKAKLIGLNKRSGQARKILATAGRNAFFETLTVRLVACTRIAYPTHDDFAALLKISEREEGVLFQGWMYAEYPSLNSMEHPIYDVWIESCAP